MPRKASNWKKYNFYIDPKIMGAARFLATSRGLTSADVVRQALQSYVVAELQKERLAPDVEALMDLVEQPTVGAAHE